MVHNSNSMTHTASRVFLPCRLFENNSTHIHTPVSYEMNPFPAAYRAQCSLQMCLHAVIQQMKW